MIIDLQRRLAEIGRIRIGQQVTTANGKTRPAKLETFRLTSADRNRINQAAQLYGGTVTQWKAPAGPQWEVITSTDALPVIVPPADMAFTQKYELWAAGGCQRRCDGITDDISDGACLCDPDARECDIHTRLSVMLRDVPGLGVWRIDTQGFYAATELAAAVDIIRVAAAHGHMLPAVLRLEQRMTKRPDQGTRRFAVPVLDIEVTPGQLVAGTATLDAGTIAIEPPRPEPQRDRNARSPATSPLTPVPADDAGEPPSIAEQVAPKTPRKRRAVTLSATGLAPRTAAQAAADLAEPPEEPVTITTHLSDEPDPPITKPQLTKLHTTLNKNGITDRDDYLTLCEYILGYRVETTKNLTKNEANKLLDTLENWQRDTGYPIGDRINDILNTTALAQAAQDELDPDG